MTLGKHDIPIGYYCGPSAIMLLTGCEYEQIRTLVNQMRGHRENQGVIGMHNHELVSTLLQLGYAVRTVITPTERKALKNHTFTGHWIVQTGGHYVAVCDGEVAENKRVWWTPIEQAPAGRKMVIKAFKVEEL